MTDFVQQHVERLSELKITLPYDKFTETDFSMGFDRPGFCEDYVYVTTCREGGFMQFSCKINFPTVQIVFLRKKLIRWSPSILDEMRLALVNVSAKAEVNIIIEYGRFAAMHVAKLNFLNLLDELLETVKGIQTSPWRTYAIEVVQCLASRAYLQQYSAKCYT
ncbi:unnamed protein product [Dibothriocephalus latus]|uniref:Uncharacterized protein n=1 Tax=Dibothriocephalus latus TaxID=60516 RepID=A0A3P7QW36_DIBLA|nr:unnamed protein product [Dibothriocephalus latus]